MEHPDQSDQSPTSQVPASVIVGCRVIGDAVGVDLEVVGSGVDVGESVSLFSLRMASTNLVKSSFNDLASFTLQSVNPDLPQHGPINL